MHPGGSPVGIARSDKRSAFAAIRVLQSHIAIGDRRDHIVIPMLVPAGFCAGGKGKSGDTGTVVIISWLALAVDRVIGLSRR